MEYQVHITNADDGMPVYSIYISNGDDEAQQTFDKLEEFAIAVVELNMRGAVCISTKVE